MATNFYYGGSIDAEFSKYKEWENQEKAKEKLKQLSTKNQYRSHLDQQVQEMTLGKINMNKVKRIDLIEVNKKLKEEEFKLQSEKISEASKKQQFKQILENDLQELRQRRLQEKQREQKDERNAGEFIEKILQSHDKSKKNEISRRSSEIQTSRSGKGFENSGKADLFPYKSPKKYYDMGDQAAKQEFFRAVSEKQLKIEKNYSRIVSKDSKEKNRFLDRWIERGMEQEIKKIDERVEIEKRQKEIVKKEMRTGLDSQMKVRDYLKEQKRNEDKEFVRLRDGLIQKDIEKDLIAVKEKRKQRENYKDELMKQIKSTSKIEAYNTKIQNNLNTPKSVNEVNKPMFRKVDQSNSKLSHETQIYKSPVERFTGSLIIQSPKESQGRFQMALLEQSPTMSRALNYRNLINPRTKDLISG